SPSVTRTGGRRPAPRASTIFAGTSIPVAVFPACSRVVRKVIVVFSLRWGRNLLRLRLRVKSISVALRCTPQQGASDLFMQPDTPFHAGGYPVDARHLSTLDAGEASDKSQRRSDTPADEAKGSSGEVRSVGGVDSEPADLTRCCAVQSLKQSQWWWF